MDASVPPPTGVTTGPVPDWYVEPSFGSRLFARTVDAVLLSVVLVGLALVVPGGAERGVLEVVTAVVGVVLTGLYETVAVARYGRTVGKAAFGLVVVDASTGGRADTLQAAERWAVFSLPSVVVAVLVLPPILSLLWGLVLVVTVLRPPLHRGVHDLAARTVVTRAIRSGS